MGNVTRGRRAYGPSPGRGVNREPFLFGPTTAYEPGGPHGDWIVLAASLVLLVDVSSYFKRIETFYRGETFRRETKLHHRKNVSAEGDCAGEEREAPSRQRRYSLVKNVSHL